MKYIGAHVSIAGGVDKAPERARKIGASAFAMFTRNQKRWSSPPLDGSVIERFASALSAAGYTPEQVIPHDGYLINLCNPHPDKRKRSLEAFRDEAGRVLRLGLSMLNFHPGNHLKLLTAEEAAQLTADAVNEVHREVGPVTLVVETTAGQGSGIGRRFEEIARIIEDVEEENLVGVCIDTCHIFAAGYDIRTEEAYERTMGEFGRIIGFPLLKAVHLNDSQADFDSSVDRHAPLGGGSLGWDPFLRMMTDPRFDGIPLVVETPEEERWPEEISRLTEASNGEQPAG